MQNSTPDGCGSQGLAAHLALTPQNIADTIEVDPMGTGWKV